jgi:hypothetical protein
LARRKARGHVKALIDELDDQGWRIEYRPKAVLAYSPDGETIVTLHYTPSARQWRSRALRELRKGGFEPKR